MLVDTLRFLDSLKDPKHAQCRATAACMSMASGADCSSTLTEVGPTLSSLAAAHTPPAGPK